MIYDTIIVGAGTAGMTAALNLLRNSKKVLLLERENIGGQISFSPRVENIPSITEISGSAFSDRLFEQVLSLGAEVELESVQSITKEDKIFNVTTDYHNYSAKSIILATGVHHKHLRLPKEEELVGNGISYCALCDGAFYKGKEVALIGDGNTALQYAILMTNYCPKVYVCTLFDKFFGDDALINTLKSKSNVEIIPNVSACRFLGESELTGVVFKRQDKSEMQLEVPALFIAIGQVPDNKAFEGLVKLDNEGYIITDNNCATSHLGVFAAGDCRKKEVRQLTTAMSDGAVAAFNICSYLDAVN